MAKYIFKQQKKDFLLEDESGKLIYEAKTIKSSLFSAAEISFTNHLTGKTDNHKVGHTVTLEKSTGLDDTFISQKDVNSYFKFDGQKIWDYLKEQGIGITSEAKLLKLQMTCEIFLNQENIASVVTRNKHEFEVNITNTDHLDLIFLTIFAITKTDQPSYNL